MEQSAQLPQGLRLCLSRCSLCPGYRPAASHTQTQVSQAPFQKPSQPGEMRLPGARLSESAILWCLCTARGSGADSHQRAIKQRDTQCLAKPMEGTAGIKPSSPLNQAALRMSPCISWGQGELSVLRVRRTLELYLPYAF